METEKIQMLELEDDRVVTTGLERLALAVSKLIKLTTALTHDAIRTQEAFNLRAINPIIVSIHSELSLLQDDIQDLLPQNNQESENADS